VFSWDVAKALANYEKHGVPFEEAATVFDDGAALEWEDVEHPSGERRWVRVGFSGEGRVLFVVYVPRSVKNEIETIRIISARQASRKERKAYSGQPD
jgi:uncharacterized DUF497 family protein